ncbi:DUF317 domain-containing protein [Streptomyces albulus]|nr:DUF317 domain-containing protein [Streptomyces noursei]
MLTSPDDGTTISYHMLASGPVPRWTAAHSGPRPWTATFSCNTPRELPHALLAPLTLLPSHPLTDTDPLKDLAEDLYNAGWKRTAYGTRTVYLSADRLCILAHTPHEEAAWQIATQTPRSNGSERWNLSLSRDAPPQLARSVIRTLVRGEPVMRRLREIPRPLRQYAVIAPLAEFRGPRKPPEPPAPPPSPSR